MKIFTQIKKVETKIYEAPIILVHGSWGSSIMWIKYADFLSKNGWEVYALDLRGHGKSEGEIKGATMEDYVSDINQIVKEYDVSNPIVIGHSMGGLVALMYARDHETKAVVAIDPSPSKEVQGEGEKKEYPEEYSPIDVGMPTDPMEVMKALPDISQEKLMEMKEMLGMESGVARSNRKLGISIPKEKLSMPVLFVGGEFGESVPFGIGIKTAKAMADYYEKEVIEITGATHPGILIGENAIRAVTKIEEWLQNNIK
ncbi:MAG: alpha/beta hydrolase [Candidatus Paceibacterota bacterium]